jgi:hypothetical protein
VTGSLGLPAGSRLDKEGKKSRPRLIFMTGTGIYLFKNQTQNWFPISLPEPRVVL